MNWLLTHGSLGLIFILLVVTGFGVPFPEDLGLLAAGVLVHRMGGSPVVAVVVCMVGVLCGDYVLFRTAKRLGVHALDRPFFKKLLPPKRRARLEAAIKKRGALIIFGARHLPGLRAPVFAMAGIYGMGSVRFVVADMLASCISVPLVVGLGYFFSNHIDKVRHGLAETEHILFLIAVTGFIAYLVVLGIRRTRQTRSNA